MYYQDLVVQKIGDAWAEEGSMSELDDRSSLTGSGSGTTSSAKSARDDRLEDLLVGGYHNGKFKS